MKKTHLLLVGIILLYSGCTKNNQNTPATFAYLNVNQTIVATGNEFIQTYDVDNDGQVDWSIQTPRLQSWRLSEFGGYYNVDSIRSTKVKTLPFGYTINSACIFGEQYYLDGCNLYEINATNLNLAGSGDFYIGFRSQNPQLTNTSFGWARLNLSVDGNTLIVKDMALNKVNGGSINVGQH